MQPTDVVQNRRPLKADLVTEYTREAFAREAAGLLSGIASCSSLEVARERLLAKVSRVLADTFRAEGAGPFEMLVRARDCAAALFGVLHERSDARSGFSVAQVFWDIACGRPRDDLSPAFYAEMIHWVRGLEGRGRMEFFVEATVDAHLSGRQAALARSDELDQLWQQVEQRMRRYADGLDEEVAARRRDNRDRILEVLGGRPEHWDRWQWQTENIITDAETLGRIVELDAESRRAVAAARDGRLPFGITPYYASLMDVVGGDRDRAVRAQVIPPADYVEQMLNHRGGHDGSCDFMREADTSPIDRVTRRYPAIVILKPYNTCPQICVYCQRNWEISQAMDPAALTDRETLEQAIRWIADHPAITEVLVTGGDPLALDDERLREILSRLAEIEHVDLIRIGSRVPVTLPMRITQELATMLGSFREPGRRDVAVITHVEHPYEVTVEMTAAVDRLRRAGLSVYNQQVYTFFVSRRFESARLRTLLRRIGIQPYYTFVPKGKEETAAYRVPIARLLQEQREESRLLPGSRRTDRAVYNVPGLGKNNLRAGQHRDLISVLPDGRRVYEFHPWEKNIVQRDAYVAHDVPILEYLERLTTIGEDTDEYQSIWYYF